MVLSRLAPSGISKPGDIRSSSWSDFNDCTATFSAGENKQATNNAAQADHFSSTDISNLKRWIKNCKSREKQRNTYTSSVRLK
jgi:hypothetical protein